MSDQYSNKDIKDMMSLSLKVPSGHPNANSVSFNNVQNSYSSNLKNTNPNFLVEQMTNLEQMTLHGGNPL